MTTVQPETAVASETPQVATGSSASEFYQVTWRRHVFAGLFTFPLMLILAISAATYPFRPQLDDLMCPGQFFLQPGAQEARHSQQLAVVQAADPNGQIEIITPATAATRSTRVNLTTSAGRNLAAFVTPYTGVVLGERDEVNHRQALVPALQVRVG
jgi:uncharacterized iron-regulated membrane protein